LSEARPAAGSGGGPSPWIGVALAGGLALGAGTIWWLMHGGQPPGGTTSCGGFTFTGKAAPTWSQVGFLFNPTACGAPPCACNTIAYVQMVRIIDEQGGYHQPAVDQRSRMVKGRGADFDGWAIDRVDLRIWGHYGRNNDDSFSNLVHTGSNQDAAVLTDSPTGWEQGSHFYAVSASVCLDKLSPCADRILGYEHWSFVVGSKPASSPVADAYPTALGFAIAEWNADAHRPNKFQKNLLPALQPWH
jgi:hypothetical protein